MLNRESATAVLRQSGVRITPQRMMIVDALTDNRSHPTVEQLYQVVRQVYPTLSLATVYQTVALLARHGLILEIHGSKDGLRCDPDTSPHAHAYCRDCGAVYDLALPAAIAETLIIPDFHTDALEISVYGHCEVCAAR